MLLSRVQRTFVFRLYFVTHNDAVRDDKGSLILSSLPHKDHVSNPQAVVRFSGALLDAVPALHFRVPPCVPPPASPYSGQPSRISCPLLHRHVRMSYPQRDHIRDLGLVIAQGRRQALRHVWPVPPCSMERSVQCTTTGSRTNKRSARYGLCGWPLWQDRYLSTS